MIIDNLLPVIRNAARALIVREDRILLLRKDGGDRGERFALPGGGQEPGETLQQTLNRECLEEIGTQVHIQDLVHVADFFKPRDTDPPSTRHLVEFLFWCTVPETYTARSGQSPDKHQVAVIWAPLEDLPHMPFYAQSLAPLLRDLLQQRSVELPQQNKRRIYLGPVD